MTAAVARGRAHGNADAGRARDRRGQHALHLGEEDVPVEHAADRAEIAAVAQEHGHELIAFQSNAEHELIERIHGAPREGVEFLIFNPGAFTHTSIALRDALLGVGLPFIEVHLSNTHAREPFRRHSYFSDIAVGSIFGLGALGYELAVRAAAERLARRS